MSERELSASALQIEERKERLTRMLDLARDETKFLIREIMNQNPKATTDDIIKQVKAKPFLINAFVREFMANIKGEQGASYKTAKDYFDTQADRLHPLFIKVRASKTGTTDNAFHLSEGMIRTCICNVKTEKEVKKN